MTSLYITEESIQKMLLFGESNLTIRYGRDIYKRLNLNRSHLDFDKYYPQPAPSLPIMSLL